MVNTFERVYAQSHIDYVKSGRKSFNEDTWTYKQLDSGVMVFTGKDAPLSQAVGIGYSGAAPETVITKLKEFYFTKECDINLELDKSFADSYETSLLENGFSIVEEGSVYIKKADQFDLSNDPKESITIVDEWNPDEAAKTITRGFLEGADNEDFDYIFKVYFDMESNQSYYGIINGEIAGGGFIYCLENWGMLCGASTLPDYRRRGVQTELIKARVKYAMERGVDTICVVVENDSASEKSMLKQGFTKLTERKKYFKKYSDLNE